MMMSDKELSFLTRFIVESDAIENIIADSQLVESQLKIRWRKGHVGAILRIESALKNSKFLTENLICRIQGLITAEQHTKPGGPKLRQECIGRYRLVHVSIGGKISPSPKLILSLMQSWVYRVAAWQKNCLQYLPDLNLQRIAIFHYEYETIHPFADGNGRSGRALIYYLMRYCNIKPFVFTSDDKYETYYKCFNNPKEMYKYFEAKLKTA